MAHYEQTSLWKIAFDQKDDGLEEPRSRLKTAYQDFRSRVEVLLQQIHKELPSLTLHDITHVDSLWRIASEIAGPDFDLNPAEAFVLGGAFLLHDAAHCRAAFPGGLQDLQQTTEWKDSAAHHGFTPDMLTEGTEPFQTVLFDTLRLLHPQRAKSLPFAKWPSSDGAMIHLLPNDDLRDAFGHIIGEIAESHWWHPHTLEKLAGKKPTAPTCLAPASWIIDMLKIAVLLRTADAAHIDANRAPRFLMSITQPQGISKEHWQFQTRLNQPTCVSDRNELIISGNPFPENELSAWWLAYDAACLANKELTAADRLLVDNHRLQRLAARSIADSHSPEAFSKHVPTDGWSPVNTNIKITDVKKLVEHFGGAKLYGNDPSAALRELLQNAVDAVHACRSLGGLNPNEGEIEVALEEASGGYWLHVTDTGIGMSRYVLTEVLLDFGHSFWRSADVHGEWSGLPSSGFESIGQFGIGFFSVFMLGEQVRVVTKRYEHKNGEAAQWLLSFAEGVNKRPTLREPIGKERLKKHGTRVSVLISPEKLKALCLNQHIWRNTSSEITFAQVCARLAPAIDLNLYVKTGSEERQLSVQAMDWKSLPAIDLLRRIMPGYFESTAGNQFGLWTHLSEIYDEAGSIVGRCAVQPSLYLGPNHGVGVVKGLLAGNVNGIAGIIMSRPQNDLARKEAIPAVLLPSLQLWAENQKGLLLEHEKLSSKQSALLAIFGAAHTGLRMGTFKRQSVSFEELISIAAELGEIIVHSGEIEFDEDDEVSRRDFEEYFDVCENVLELPRVMNNPKWLELLNENQIPCETWSLDSALETALATAWGQGEWDADTVTVGYVNGTEISRNCKIASRLAASANIEEI
ncbi:ATP-binding protein [Geobacter sp. DSM 9736]|uniref:HD domain-containing protein n=1 Tax=Geobacter sp. DSM 9736 TaxID=1277350 RepID=UPI000B5077DA|nr:ATP-binding protein [Geobacter sp. DSM 9736]SNB47479.1 Histidine kinase-, DNA gyrase B-, and HSP90-like ATPase [Geobacter sp. DSM 9736]